KKLDEGREAVVGSKEKENRLVFDPGKIIGDNGTTADLSYDEVDAQRMLMGSGDDNAMTGLDEYAAKNVGKDVNLNMQNNINAGRRTEKANIPGVGCVKYDDDFKGDGNNGAREVDRMAKTLIQEESKEEFDLGSRYQGDNSGSYMKKRSNDSRLIDVVIEIRKLKINENNIPVVGVKNDCNRDKAPDGRAEIVNIEMKDVKETRDEDVEYTYYHECGFYNERSCHEKRIAGDHESNSKEVEVKNRSVDEVAKYIMNGHIDSERESRVNETFKDEEKQIYLKEEYLPEIRIANRKVPSGYYGVDEYPNRTKVGMDKKELMGGNEANASMELYNKNDLGSHEMDNTKYIEKRIKNETLT
ncbi:23948_t:CDS:2, partial [Gigaspora rosea]